MSRFRTPSVRLPDTRPPAGQHTLTPRRFPSLRPPLRNGTPSAPRPRVNPSIKRLPPTDRPRERLHALGPTCLTDTELVALVLGGDLHTATEIVGRVGGASGIRRGAVGQLRDVPGVGEARACQIVAALELGARSASRSDDRTGPLNTPPRAYDVLRDLARLDVEELHVLALDGRHRLITRFLAARGSQNVVHVSPRDIFRRLLRDGAMGAVLAHNHPSGDPVPSEDDILLTSRLKDAGELVGVRVLDHMIIAAEGWFSITSARIFREPPDAPAGPPVPLAAEPSRARR